MKGLCVFLVLAVAVGFGLLGCSDANDPIVAPADQPQAISLAKGPVVHSVTGNGNIWLDGKMGVLTVNARLYEDGTVGGQLNMIFTAYNPKAKYHGDVVAVTFYENYTFTNGVSGPTAVVWWRESFSEPYVGKYLAIFFVDNGQGSQAAASDWVGPNTWPPADAVSSITPQEIADQAPAFFVPLDVGNVTIH